MTMRRLVVRLRFASAALLLLFLSSASCLISQAGIQAANEKDHQRLLDLAGIKQLRPPSSNDPKSANPTNYDESKANQFPKLPAPLLLNDGKPVTSAEMWWNRRRPQIVDLFNREILGQPPASLPIVTWQLLSTTRENNGPYPIVFKRLAGHVNNAEYPAIKVDIDLVLATPADAAGPVPVMLQLGFPNEFKMALVRPIPESPPPAFGFYGQEWQRLLLAKGWGYAVLSAYSFQADNGAGLTEGIIGLANRGRPRSLDVLWACCAPGPGAPAALSTTSPWIKPSTPTR